MKRLIRLALIGIFQVSLASFLLGEDTAKTVTDEFKIIPINHASFIIESDKATIYVDPVGKLELYKNIPSPDLILITDIHHDHLDSKLLASIKKDKTEILGPKEAIKQLGYGKAISNGETKSIAGIEIEAIPMYNTTKERLQFHPKDRGNGYVLTLDKKRIYISGDTEDIPEMRQLKNIDIAFLCMNLPYTMTVEQAASVVLEFKPKVVIPYHYRGKNGMSDLAKFQKQISKDKNIKAQLLKWY